MWFRELPNHMKIQADDTIFDIVLGDIVSSLYIVVFILAV